jgi:hypothetical protein
VVARLELEEVDTGSMKSALGAEVGGLVKRRLLVKGLLVKQRLLAK